MNIKTQTPKVNPIKTPSAPAKSSEAQEEASVAQDTWTPTEKKPERGSFGTMLKRGLHFGAFLGVPAAMGAASSSIGEAANSEGGKLIGTFLGANTSAVYGVAHGGYGGWAMTESHDPGSRIMAILTVPAGAGLGALAATGLSLAGAAGGMPVAAGLAGAGFVLGMINGYRDPNMGM